MAGSGSSAQKQLPRPGSLSTPTAPSISVASSRQIDRPSPLPPKRRVVDWSACVNGLEQPRLHVRRDARAGVVHLEAQPLRRRARAARSDTPPCAVNFSALLR